MISISQVLQCVRLSVRPFSIEYQKVDGTASYKTNILGSIKPPQDGQLVLFQDKKAFSIYVDFIRRFDNEIVDHTP